MKNHFKKAICIVAAFATFTSMFGCTVRNAKDDQTTTTVKDSGVVDYKELPTENGTAVYTYKYKDDSGKEQTGEENIDVDIAGNITFKTNEDIENEKFVSVVGPKRYQMTEEQAEAIAKNPSNYQEFYFVEYIQNNSDKVMAFKTLKVNNDSSNGIWIKTDLGAEFAILSGAVQPVYVYGIADITKYDEESLKTAFDAVKIDLEYALVNSAQEDVDWETAEKMTMSIH